MRDSGFGSLRDEVEDGGACGFGAGASCCRDRDKGKQGFSDGKAETEGRIDEVEEIIVGEAGVEVHQLGSVNDRSASDCEECRRSICLGEFDGFPNAMFVSASVMSKIPQPHPAHELSFGSTIVLSNNVNSISSSFKPSTARFIASSFTTLISVTTHTRLKPRFFKSMPASLVQPGPKRMLEAAISKAYSFCLELSTGVARDLLAWLNREGVG